MGPICCPFTGAVVGELLDLIGMDGRANSGDGGADPSDVKQVQFCVGPIIS